ncbi:RICIN domain-containing protein [Micromonospora sp. PLK6-60]|uniref:RICIN domain-containing protein n=1 Tax=Micromonospora sp. PLK6-60 TaxID=2873383 RepID=UPI001CA70B67|nr:RICIN domain-containing protein [Micromonospora sp. PLK6-60]MBY8872280.1 RICIN domain-containing protein [Micromonospora sp. PLK6-60]
MAVSDDRNDPAGTVYGAARRRPGLPGLPRDPLLRAALAIGVIGVLLGAFFASGALGGGGDEPVIPAAAATPQPAAQESSAGAETTEEAVPTAEPSPTPEASTAPPPPPAPAGPPTGPQVFRAATSGLCVGVAGGDPEGADAMLVDCTGGPEQQWVATPVDGEVVTLTNAASGKCLDLDGGSGDDGAVLQQWSCHGQPNQQWRVVAIGTGPVLLTPVHSGKCVKVRDNATTAGAVLEQSTCTATAEQQWTLG